MIRQPRVALLGLLTSAVLFAAPASALAPTATSEGAQRLTEVLQRYFGKPAAGQPGSVTVVPGNNEYKVTLDLKKMYAPLAGVGFAIEGGQWEMTLAEQTDGTWRFASSSYPALSVKGPALEQKVTAAGAKMEGIFDPASASIRNGKYVVEQLSSVANGPGITQNNAFNQLTYTIDSKANGQKAVDMVSIGTLGSLTMDMTIGDKTAGKSAAGNHVLVRASQVKGDVTASEMRMRDLLDLWAFFIAHPGKEAAAAGQADLKALLRNAVPGFKEISETVSMGDFSVETGIGKFSGKDVGFSLGISGAVPNSHYNIRIKSGAVSVPQQLLPPWSAGFMPSAIDLSMNASGMDFAAAAKEAIEDFTLAGDKPFADADGPKIARALAPRGSVTIDIPPGRITAGLLDVQVNGSMDAGPGALSGKVNLSAKGLDAALDSLKGAMGSDKTAAQAFGALSIAKGLGKPGASGETGWVVEFQPDRTILINGTPFGGK